MADSEQSARQFAANSVLHGKDAITEGRRNPTSMMSTAIVALADDVRTEVEEMATP